VARIDGTTKPGERQKIIDAFQAHAGPAVLLPSLKACSMGVNLTSAQMAVICEPVWNPLHASQAAARCHRLGQEKPVQIVRLCCSRTYEEKVQVSGLLRPSLFQCSCVHMVAVAMQPDLPVRASMES
jgi:SNF2 family DNA or RNA helicase